MANDFCQQEFLDNEEKHSTQTDLRRWYEVQSNVIDGDLVFLEKMKQEDPQLQLNQYKNSMLLDHENVGQSLLVTEHLTEVFKVNNLYHFNIDFQNAFRINQLKIVFDEKNRKQSSFKMRVNISIPEHPSLTQEEIRALKENQDSPTIKSQPRMKLIFSKQYNENQIYQLNQLAFKKSSINYFKQDSHLHRLTIDLDQMRQRGCHGGFVSRYMTIQVQLLETMKSTKESPIMVNTCLMFP